MVHGFTDRCSDCKFFLPIDKPKSDPFNDDGLCGNVRHHPYESLERRKAGRPVGSRQSACFDFEVN